MQDKIILNSIMTPKELAQKTYSDIRSKRLRQIDQFSYTSSKLKSINKWINRRK